MMKGLILSLIICFTLQAQGRLGILFDDDLFVYSIDIAGTAEYASKTLPVDIGLDSIKFTIIGWVKTPATFSGQHHILSTDKNATPRGWSLLMESGTLRFYTNTGTGVGRSGGVFSAGTWYFIAVVCTTTTQASGDYLIYKDGVSQVLSGTGSVVIENANPLMVGQQGYAGFERYWLGQIGEIQIIREHNLSQAEITAAFTGGLKASYAAGTVVAWYKWSGGSDADMLKDYSASGNNLTGNNLTTADQVKVGKTYK